MGTSYIDSRYTINGLLQTDNTKLDNLGLLANAAGCWMSYDTHEGKFAVVINQAGTSEHSFDSDNIIGGVHLSTTPLDKLYNSVKVTFPHEDLKGAPDWVQITIPPADRLATEFDNVLNLDYKVVTNPVQAELLGFIELKQSRVDKVVTFKTDFSKMGVKAGDLIDITLDEFGWVAKMFRVISVSETDADSGAIEIDITALEYDPSVYNEDLTRFIRSDSSGIVPLASLPAPTKPVISTVTMTSRPYVSISTSLIGGIVTELEYWSSTDVSLADNLRSYSLLKKEVSSSQFPLNTPILTQVDTVSASTFVVKVRAVNSDGVSVFSLPSDTTTYSGTQVTDAIMNNLQVEDEEGNLVSTAALLSLLSLLSKNIFTQAQIIRGAIAVSAAEVTTAYNAVTTPPPAFGTGDGVYPNPGGVILMFTLPRNYDQVVVTLQTPSGSFYYDTKIGGTVVTRTSFGYAPSSLEVYYGGQLLSTSTSDWQTQSITTNLFSALPGDYLFVLKPLVTYDLTQEDVNYIYPYNYTILPNASGDGANVSIYGYN